MKHDKIQCNTIFFDAGMTLIHPTPRFQDGITGVLAENGFTVAPEDMAREAVAAMEHIENEIYGGRRYCINDDEDRAFWSDVYERLLTRLGLDGGARNLGLKIYEYYQRPAAFDLFPDSLPTLKLLRKAGFRLGIISNFSTILEPVLVHRQVRDFFDPLIVSASENCMKPDKLIFDIALQRAAAHPAHCVMIGDNPLDDIQGAAAAGIKPILINRSGKPPAIDSLQINTLTELLNILVYHV